MIKLRDITELFKQDHDEVNGIEILNQHPNSHNINFTDKDFDDIIGNFEKEKSFEPHLKVSHTDQQTILKELYKLKDVEFGEEIPKPGFVKKLYTKNKRLFADFGKIPKALKEILFNGKMFRSVSPEILPNFRGSGTMALRAVALLNNPSQKHIGDVHLAEAMRFGGEISITKLEEPEMSEKNTDAGSQVSEETIVTKVLNGLKSAFTKGEIKLEETPVAPIVELDGKPENKQIIALAERLEALEATNKSLSASLLKKDDETKKLSERTVAIENEARKATADAICEGARLDGVSPAIINAAKPLMFSDLGEQTIKLSETVDGNVVEVDKSIREIVKGIFAASPKLDFSERTGTTIEKPTATDDKAMEERVEKLMESGMDEYSALIKAGVEFAKK